MATGVAMTTYLADALLNETLRATNFAPPATVYLALFTSNPGEGGSQTGEVTGGSYARQAVTFGVPVDNAPNGRKCTNSSTVTFPTATANWGVITHVGIMDASSAGNMLYYGALDASKTINATDTFSMPAGNLVVGLD